MNPIIVLCEIKPFDTVSGTTKTLRVCSAGKGYSTFTGSSNQWLPFLTQAPVVSYTMNSDAGVGSSGADYGSLQLRFPKGVNDAAGADISNFKFYDYDGATFKMWYGDPTADFSTFTLALTARCGPLELNSAVDGKLILRGAESDLDKPLLTLAYAGSGNEEGPIELKGQKKPWCSGVAKNLEPRAIDPVYHIYQYHGYGQTEDVTSVWENAIALAAPTATVTTYAALKALTLNPGQWAKAPAVGMFRIGSEPAGKITCDVIGAKDGASTPKRTAEICAHLIKQAGVTTIDTSSVSALDSSFPYDLGGVYITSDTQVFQAVNDLVSSINGYCFAKPDGNWFFGRNVGTKSPTAINKDRSILPTVVSFNPKVVATRVYKVRIGGDECWSVHSEDQISDAVRQAAQSIIELQNDVIDAQNQADLAISKLGIITNNGILDASEKPEFNRLYTQYSSEKSGINARASALGITTENTDYNNKYNAWNSYLSGLSPAFTSLTTDTTIDRATWDVRWNDLLNAKSTLLNKMFEVANTNANWASVTGAGKPADYADVTAANVALGYTGQTPWGTLTQPVASLTQPQNNLFPYPRPSGDGRSIASLGWNTDGSTVAYFMNGSPASGWCYLHSRPSGGGAATAYVWYDMPAQANTVFSASLAGYGGGGNNFSPYIEAVNASLVPISSRMMTLNANTNRYEAANFTMPAGSAYLRVVCRGIYPASGSYQDMVWWNVKVEAGATCTTFNEVGSRISGSWVEWNTGQTLNALKPDEYGSNKTETRTALALNGQGYFATANYLYASRDSRSGFDSIIPDSGFQDPIWWGFQNLPNIGFTNMDTYWQQTRAIQFIMDRDFDFTGQMFSLEVGSTYRIRLRIWNNDTGAGWSGAFWPMLHFPNVAWWSLKHGYGINPDTANASNAIVANQDTGYAEFYFRCSHESMRQIQFRFKSTARGSVVYFQAQIDKVPQLGRDLMRNGTTNVYAVSDIETGLGVAGSIWGQGDLAVTNKASLPFGSNAVVDPLFRRDLFAYKAGIGTSNGNTSVAVGLDWSGFTGQRRTAYGRMIGTFAVDEYFDVLATRGTWNGGNLDDLQKFGTPMSVGQRVYYRCLMAKHRCLAGLYLLLCDSSGNLVEATSVYGGRNYGGANGVPSNFDVVGSTYTITNSNVAFGMLMWRMHSTGENDPYIFFCEPALGVLPAGQTTLPPFSEGRSDPMGDQTSAQQVTVEATTSKTLAADYTGAFPSGTLPTTVGQPKVVKGGVTITTSDSTTYTLQNAQGGCSGNVTVNNTNGSGSKGVVTIGTGLNASGSYEMVISVSGVAYPPIKTTVTKTVAAPPAGGGGSSSTGSTDVNISIASTSMSSVTQINGINVASGKTANCYADVNYETSLTSGAGNRQLSAKWQYSPAGANSWTDITTAVSGSNSYYDSNTADGTVGGATINQSKSGLTAGNYDFRLVGAINSTANGAQLYIYGSASVSAA